MKFKQLSAFAFLLVISLYACKKVKLAGDEPQGEALNAFTLVAPGNFATLSLNSATPSDLIDISWTKALPGLSTEPTYKWVAALKTGDINAPILELPSNNSGKDVKLSLTHKQIDDALAAKGVPAEGSIDLIWSVVADNGSVKVRAADVYNIKINRFRDGATPFKIYGPVSSKSNVAIDPNSTSKNIVFKWQKSIPGKVANVVKYKIQIVGEEDEFVAPFVIEASSDNDGVDTTYTISYKNLSDSLTAKGYTSLSEVAKLKWRVIATTGNFSLNSLYENTLYIQREVKLYLVGGDCPIGWTPTKALRFIEDTENAGVFYIYTLLQPGNFGFKFLALQADWDAPGQIKYGGSNSSASGNNPTENTGDFNVDGGNLATPSGPGIYRIQVNLNTGKYLLNKVGVGVVGFVNSWNPNSPIAMKYVSTNRFILLQDFTTGNEPFKFHDGVGGWDRGFGKSNYWGPASGIYEGPGSSLAKPGENVFNAGTKPAAGRWRLIWDGTNVTNLRYTVSAPGELYIIGGDANLGGWNNSVSNASIPQFTYQGNGQWKVTVTVSGPSEFKLIMEKGNWDMLYGQGAGGSMQLRHYDSDPPAFSFPSAGTYTVNVDEYNQTISY